MILNKLLCCYEQIHSESEKLKKGANYVTEMQNH